MPSQFFRILFSVSKCRQLNYWQNEFKPVNNMGKWSRSVAIESYTKKIFKLEQQIKLNKTKNNEQN